MRLAECLIFGGAELTSRGVRQPTVDALCGIFIVIYCGLRMTSSQNSSNLASSILGGLDQIPWADPDVQLAAKQKDFFALVEKLTTLIEWEVKLDAMCYAILVVSLLRVIQCTSLHPRLALLTGLAPSHEQS